MKRSLKIAAGIAASLSLALATAASAHPGWQGGAPCAATGAGYGMGPGGGFEPGAGMGPRGGYGPGAGMGPGFRSGYGPGAGRGPGSGGLASQLMTPEEWAAHREKMQNAATPGERQQIAAANHAEMQKRAAEKGITLPQERGPRGGYGPGFRRAPQAPAATEHQH